jgi:serine/threonine protein phosphatase PrpC
VRSNNEDSVLANALLGLAVLADGMGGYNLGSAKDTGTTLRIQLWKTDGAAASFEDHPFFVAVFVEGA